jgi:hypothetical protein
LWQPRMQGQHSSWVAARTQGITHDQGVDGTGVNPCTLKQRLHYRGRDVVRVQCFESATTRHHGAACPSGNQWSG